MLAEPFAPEELEGYFNSPEGPLVRPIEDDERSAKVNSQGIITILRQLVVPPSELGRAAALKTGSEYLRNTILRNGADPNDLKDLLRGWVWLYPDEPDLRIVLASLELKLGDLFNAFCRLKEVYELEVVNSAVRRVLDRRLELWVSEAQKNYNQIGMTRHILKTESKPLLQIVHDRIDPKNI